MKVLILFNIFIEVSLSIRHYAHASIQEKLRHYVNNKLNVRNNMSIQNLSLSKRVKFLLMGGESGEKVSVGGCT